MSTTPSTLPSTILYLNAAQWRKNNPYLRMAVWRCGCKGRNMRMSRLNPANGLNIRTRGGGNMPAHCSQDLGFVKWFFLGGRGGGGEGAFNIITQYFNHVWTRIFKTQDIPDEQIFFLTSKRQDPNGMAVACAGLGEGGPWKLYTVLDTDPNPRNIILLFFIANSTF